MSNSNVFRMSKEDKEKLWAGWHQGLSSAYAPNEEVARTAKEIAYLGSSREMAAHKKFSVATDVMCTFVTLTVLGSVAQMKHQRTVKAVLPERTQRAGYYTGTVECSGE